MGDEEIPDKTPKSEDSHKLENIKQAEKIMQKLAEGMSYLKLSHIKPKPFTTVENFSAFCQRFAQYIYLSKLADPCLYILFLQLLDDRTYQKLVNVQLHQSEMGNAKLFCAQYIAKYYPDSAIQSLQTEVLSYIQSDSETIEDFSFRLKEKAMIAFPDDNIREINCKIAFLKGVRNIDIRRKLNEVNLVTFDEAIEMAKRLERVDNMMTDSHVDINSIMTECEPCLHDVENSHHTSRNPKKYRIQSPNSRPKLRGRVQFSDDRESRSRKYTRSSSERSARNNSDSESPVQNGRDRSLSPYRRSHSRNKTFSRDQSQNNIYYSGNRGFNSNPRNFGGGVETAEAEVVAIFVINFDIIVIHVGSWNTVNRSNGNTSYRQSDGNISYQQSGTNNYRPSNYQPIRGRDNFSRSSYEQQYMPTQLN